MCDVSRFVQSLVLNFSPAFIYFISFDLLILFMFLVLLYSTFLQQWLLLTCFRNKVTIIIIIIVVETAQ